jgi:hypothetical protein
VNWPAGRSSETPRRAWTAESPSPYVRVKAVAVTACVVDEESRRAVKEVL